MSRTVKGWLFVSVQIALLFSIVIAPAHDHWATPTWLSLLGWMISIAGVVVAIAAGLGLGTALTPTPVPSGRGQLTTTGLYGFVRHPIYTGVLAIVLGIVIRSGSVLTLALGMSILLFFTFKARWEEERLREHYVDYEAYAARTPRFVPRFRLRPTDTMSS